MDGGQGSYAFARVFFLIFPSLGFSFLFLDSFNFRIGEIGLLLVVWKSRLRTVDPAAEIRKRARSVHNILAFSSSVYYYLFNLIVG